MCYLQSPGSKNKAKFTSCMKSTCVCSCVKFCMLIYAEPAKRRLLKRLCSIEMICKFSSLNTLSYKKVFDRSLYLFPLVFLLTYGVKVLWGGWQSWNHHLKWAVQRTTRIECCPISRVVPYVFISAKFVSEAITLFRGKFFCHFTR